MHLILGTAGHIDHGKSSLVRALTGTDPDRLPEEKARGVTIDLGFAHLSLKQGELSYELGIIDVPGHADFVNNMVSGVGALDIALFIIAADDGWMPQSEEHLHILTYLGIKRVIIALTKSDLCDDIPFAVEVVRDEIKDTAIADAAIVPVASTTGEGMEQLKQTIFSTLKDCPPPADAGKPRLAIDRLFSPKGTGTVVTGTLSGGSIQLGDTLTLQPLGLRSRVRYIQNHNQSLDSALPGMRTALNLPDLPIQSPGKPGAKRGHTLSHDQRASTTNTLDVEITRLARNIPGSKPRPLRHTETVILHHGCTHSPARVILLDRTHLNPGEKCLAQLRLESPLFLLTGDSVVLRDGAQQNTLAGATVLDAHPLRQGFRADSRAQFLQPRANLPDDLSTYLTSQLIRDHQLDAETPLPNSPFSAQQISREIEKLQQAKLLTSFNGRLLDRRWWDDIIKQAGHAVRSWHSQHPDLPHMPLTELELSLNDCPAELLELVPEALSCQGYQCQDNGISHSSHQLTLTDDLIEDAKAIMGTLDRSGLRPPSKANLATTAKAEQAMKFLIRSGKIIELDAKIVISQKAAQAAAEQVCHYIQTNGQATASELRQHLDSTRKIVMPLLEHFDAQGITRRDGNHRNLI